MSLLHPDLPALVDGFAGGQALHAVNFHHTPAHRVLEYDRQLAALAERFEPATEDGLAAFFATGRWPGRRPGVIVALYNGARSNVDVMRPLLERHGLLGWYFLATAWVGCPVGEQRAFAAARALSVVPGEYPDGRVALSWDEARGLAAAGHVIASHTRHHVRATGEALRVELLGAQEDIARETGRPARSLAWLGGAAFGEDGEADAAALAAGHEFLFSNVRVQRLPRA